MRSVPGQHPVQAFVGLGSNLENPVEQVERALAELDRISRSRLLSASSLYRSAPMGPSDQPDYINAVALVETGLTALELLTALQQIENQHRRERGRRWGPRSLDLDLLLYGDEKISHPELTVPHPGIADRDFVLLPLAELSPDLLVPGLARVRDLLGGCLSHGASRIADD